MSDTLDKIKGWGLSLDAAAVGTDSNIKRPTLPIDGDVFSTSAYLNALNGADNEEYVRYTDHLEYFTSLFRLVGNDEIEQLSPHIMRQWREYGKVGIMKLKGKLLPVAVIREEKDIYQKLTEVEVISLRTGTGYTKEMKSFTVSPDKIVVIRENYMGLPFIFRWGSAISRIITLSQAAVTGSIAAVKKFKRNQQTNNSVIARLESQSMIDPTKPWVTSIVTPASYMTELEKGVTGEAKSGNSAKGILPNEITFEGTSSSAQPQWDNLKSYIEFEYFQKGRRINTNKKNERNIASEIDTETINFDILDERSFKWLRNGIKELNKKFGLNVSINAIVEEKDTEDKGDKDA